jgi:putative transposase
MLQTGLSPQEIATILNVSEQYISKWKIRFEKEGAVGLRLAYRGKPSYLNADQHRQVVEWIEMHDTMRIEELRDYLESQYGVNYESKQSYYELLSAAGMSYHQTTATNPKYDEEKVMQKRAELKKKWHNINRK